MRRFVLYIVSLICLVLIAVPVLGQEDEGNTAEDLLNAMSVVPDTPEAKSWFSYINLRAAEAARPGANRPDTLQDFLDGDDSIGATLWWQAFMGITNGPYDVFQNFRSLGNMPETVGIEFMEIEQAIEWGQPPQSGTVLLGDFDTDAIAEAHINREYSPSDLNGLTLLCHDGVGCEGGADMDFENRNVEIPFGGQFGQSRPLLVLENGIVSSSSYETLEATSQIESGNSLANAAEYHVIVEALDKSAIVIQALITTPEQFLDSYLATFSNLDEQGVESVYADLAETALSEPMPAYELFALVDQTVETSQLVSVMLVYSTEEDAQTAAELIPNRINEYYSVRNRLPMTDNLEDRGISFTTSVFTSEESGKSVVMIDFTAPVAAALPIEGRFQQSSMVNNLLYQMILTLDTGWISTGLPSLEDVQAALSE